MNKLMVLLLVGGCANAYDTIPEEAREPSSVELEAAMEQTQRYNDLISEVTDGCWQQMERVLVIDANREQMLLYCKKDEPGHCPLLSDGSRDLENWTSLSNLGCAGGCYIQRSDCSGLGWPSPDCTTHPIVISWEGWDQGIHMNNVRHEITHGITWCMTKSADDYHKHEEVWGAGGVWTL